MEWFDAHSSFPDGPDSKLFNENGDHRNISDYHELHFFDTENFKEDTLDGVMFLSLAATTIAPKEMKLIIVCFNLSSIGCLLT